MKTRTAAVTAMIANTIVLMLLVGMNGFLSGCTRTPPSPPTKVEYLSWSPANNVVALVASDDEGTNAQIWLANAEPPVNPRRVFRTQGSMSGVPVWRSDGRGIALGAFEPGGGRLYFVTTTDPDRPEFLTHGAWPDWSPGDRKLTFTQSTDRGTSRLGIVSVATGTAIHLSTLADPMFPRWSPDGQWISFVGTAREGQKADTRGTYIIAPDGSSENALDLDNEVLVHRVWTDSDRILCEKVTEASQYEVWEIDVHSGGRSRVFSASTQEADAIIGGGDMRPRWSAQNREILIRVRTSSRPFVPRAWNIYKADLNTGTLRPLTKRGEDHSPCWSNDGSTIAFVRGGSAIWMMDADGSNQRELISIDDLIENAR